MQEKRRTRCCVVQNDTEVYLPKEKCSQYSFNTKCVSEMYIKNVE